MARCNKNSRVTALGRNAYGIIAQTFRARGIRCIIMAFMNLKVLDLFRYENQMNQKDHQNYSVTSRWSNVLIFLHAEQY
jgi:hypothetical protein